MLRSFVVAFGFRCRSLGGFFGSSPPGQGLPMTKTGSRSRRQ
ncbi:hypothetical protein PITC_021130 [Penicillium italicum]|uniref:Uncharacterized protein n=1 Tax=Penicillium italicum TaxID=40296 RepID=A0A0A2KDL0_PENIT|nr:hypothetical protein PITC_021130 [Penicillium italicum]